ncbi:hypothetical protein CXF72_18240 [Psychromonas sp. MB-3u-54]|nr:hypothetical protein CXF72_18240 [Psychromonas sp. MB-3u-54]
MLLLKAANGSKNQPPIDVFKIKQRAALLAIQNASQILHLFWVTHFYSYYTQTQSIMFLQGGCLTAVTDKSD